MILNLIQRLFGIEEISVDRLIKERNKIMAEIPVNKQVEAWEKWENAYYGYRKRCFDEGRYNFEIKGRQIANNELKNYIRREK